MNRNKFAIMALAIFTLMVSACGPKTPEVKLTVSPASLKIKVGEVGSIKAKVTPENTTVSFSSTNNKIATVNEKGEIKGEAEGNATIVVKAGEQTKRISVLVYKPETDYSARMIGNKDNALALPFYIPKRDLMKELFDDIKAANAPFGWRYANPYMKEKDPEKVGYYFAPITENGELLKDRYILAIRYNYVDKIQAHIELGINMLEEQNPFATEPGKEKIKDIANAYGFTGNGTFANQGGKIGHTYTAYNTKLGLDEQLSIILYAQPNKDGLYKVFAHIVYHYHQDHD